MIITPLFYEFDNPLTISKKLGLEFSNLKKQNKKYLLKQLIQELKWYTEDEVSGKKIKIQDILLSSYYVNFFSDKVHHNEIECLKTICDNIVSIYTIDSYQSMFFHENLYNLNPTCETSIEEKFIHLFSFLECNSERYSGKCAEIDIAYNDNRFGFYSDILQSMVWHMAPKSLEINNPYRYESHENEVKYKMESVLTFGKQIDNFFNSKKDFMILDFIMNTLSTNEKWGTHWIVEMVALLELLIAKHDYKSLRHEFRKKLPQFLPDDIDNKDQWIILVYEIRSKIAHGDYLGLVKKSEQYADTFMKNFMYDYYENNRLAWIISNISFRLSEVVAKVIKTMLNCRTLITKIKES